MSDEKTLPNSFCETINTLISKPGKYATRKQKSRQITLMSINEKS